MTFVLRWVDKMLSAHEEFIGLYLVENIKSNTVVAVIKDTLEIKLGTFKVPWAVLRRS